MATSVAAALYEAVLYRIRNAKTEQEVEDAIQSATWRALDRDDPWPQLWTQRIQLEAAEKRRELGDDN